MTLRTGIVLATLALVPLAACSGAAAATSAAPAPASSSAAAPAPSASATGAASPSGSSQSYTMADVAKHNSQTDCWAAIDGDVYDLTQWISRHPGGPDKIIGVSAQTVEQAILAEQRGADYLGVGAVFHTGSKADAEDVSHETLTAICNAVKIPVIAIGGITRDNVTELSGSGICGIAVISAIFAQKDIVSATKDLKEQTLRMLENK